MSSSLSRSSAQCCSCIATFARQQQINEAKALLINHGIGSNTMVMLRKTNSPTLHMDVERILYQSGVPKSSHYCYQCVLEMGYRLLIISGSEHLVEQVSSQLEQFGEVDISVHFT